MCFGAMLAWTPGLFWLAFLLWTEPRELDELNHDDLSIAVDAQQDQPRTT